MIPDIKDHKSKYPILCFKGLVGDFDLDGINIGDYIEAEFQAYDGILGRYDNGMDAPITFYGYRLHLKFSGCPTNHGIVQLRLPNSHTALMFKRRYRDKLVLKSLPTIVGKYLFYRLVINDLYLNHRDQCVKLRHATNRRNDGTIRE